MNQEKRFRFKLQHVIYILLIGAFAYAIYNYRDQLVDIVDVVQQGTWYLILAAFGLLVVSVLNQAMWYSSIYEVLEIPNGLRELVPLYLNRRFVTVAAPSGGFSGWIPFLHFARQNNLAVGAVFVANMIYTILWYSAFSGVLLVGLLFLFIRHDLQWFEISASLVILAIDLVMIGVFISAWIRPQMFRKELMWAVNALDWVTKLIRQKNPFTAEKANRFYDDIEDAIVLMKDSSKRSLMVPLLHAMLNEAINLVILFVIMLAFGVQMSYGGVVAVYSASILFFIVSPTPGGLGFVEGTLVLIMTGLEVTLHQATVVMLAYRGITFWLPFVLGFGALRWVNRIGGAEAQS